MSISDAVGQPRHTERGEMLAGLSRDHSLFCQCVTCSERRSEVLTREMLQEIANHKANSEYDRIRKEIP